MSIPSPVVIVCSCCGTARQGREKQPKQLAKKLGWKHGNGKGVWVCPECRKFISSQPK